MRLDQLKQLEWKIQLFQIYSDGEKKKKEMAY